MKETLERIEALLRDSIGLDPESMGPHAVRFAILACMTAAGARDADAYLKMLADPRERERLIAAVAVPESSFFRDPGSFEALRDLARERRDVKLRILSLPCASGEEPYSIAMTLLDAGLAPTQFTIDAVDIRAGAIDGAHSGVFRPSAFRTAMAVDARSRYFDDFAIRARVRGLVRFQTGNLLDPLLLRGRTFEVVFCKNLLIYFTPEARARAVVQLQRLLAPGGRLFAGASEVGWLQATGKFELLAPATAMMLGPASEASRVA